MEEYLKLIEKSMIKALNNLHEFNVGKASQELGATLGTIRTKLLELKQLRIDFEVGDTHEEER